MERSVNKTLCQYALLRFRPFVETGEFANVGIVLMAPEKRFFGYRLLTRYGRVTQFFNELDRKVYLNARALFREELDRFTAELRCAALDGRKTVADVDLANILFGELTRQREAILQFDEPRLALAEDPKAKLQELFEHYVERKFVTKAYQERLLERDVRHILTRARINNEYQPHKVGNTDFSVNFPFVHISNEKPTRIIKPLYLAHPDTTRLLTHGGQWVDKVRRLRNRNALPDGVLFPVTAPAKDTRQFVAFEEIKTELAEQDVQIAPANDEALILKFAVNAR